MRMKQAGDFWARGTAPPEHSPVAFGGEVGLSGLLHGYRNGLLAMPTLDDEVAAGFGELYQQDINDGLIALFDGPPQFTHHIPWWSPNPRPLIAVGELHLDRRTREFLRVDRGWTASCDTAFERVVTECARGRKPQWITDDLAAGFAMLHAEQLAHSVEIWDGDNLIGGLFGVRVGTVFSLDSMFYRTSHASKAALWDLQQRLAATDVKFIDVQWDSPHWRRHGAQLVSRERYLAILGTPSSEPALITEKRAVHTRGPRS